MLAIRGKTGMHPLQSGVPPVAADWLEKDLRAVKPETPKFLFVHFPTGCRRYYEVIEKYKVSQIFGGHNHAYAYYNYGAPAYTAFNVKGSGTGNICVVAGDDFATAHFCYGCKNGRHSRRCPISWPDHFLLAQLTPLFGPKRELADEPLEGAAFVTDVEQRWALVRGRFTLNAANTVGVRFRTREATHEVACSSDRVTIVGVPFPLPGGSARDDVDVTVFAHKNLLTVWAAGQIVCQRDVNLEEVVQVVPFAKGGKATITNLTIQAIRDDPDNRQPQYKDPCAHGALRRNP